MLDLGPSKFILPPSCLQSVPNKHRTYEPGMFVTKDYSWFLTLGTWTPNGPKEGFFGVYGQANWLTWVKKKILANSEFHVLLYLYWRAHNCSRVGKAAHGTGSQAESCDKWQGCLELRPVTERQSVPMKLIKEAKFRQSSILNYLDTWETRHWQGVEVVVEK